MGRGRAILRQPTAYRNVVAIGFSVKPEKLTQLLGALSAAGRVSLFELARHELHEEEEHGGQLRAGDARTG